MSEEIIWEKRGHIRIMTFNRPEAMNAANVEMLQLHGQYFQEFVEDDDAWVLIFTGTGRAFSTGLDLKAIKEIFAMQPRPRTLTSPDPPEIWKPIIAAINGYAVGLGCELALACDIRIAADDARIGLPEVKRALVPGAGGCQRLSRLVPLGNALMMLCTGDWIDAQEAYRIGLVQKVVPRDQLLDEAIQLAERICDNAPGAVRTVKEAAYRGLEVPLREALVQCRDFDVRNRQTSVEDIEEGVKAFAEKRKPVYKGR
jgi:enoyl-CoA hydratase/carnithine racemase